MVDFSALAAQFWRPGTLRLRLCLQRGVEAGVCACVCERVCVRAYVIEAVIGEAEMRVRGQEWTETQDRTIES